jgi:hypothetical protein
MTPLPVVHSVHYVLNHMGYGENNKKRDSCIPLSEFNLNICIVFVKHSGLTSRKLLFVSPSQ